MKYFFAAMFAFCICGACNTAKTAAASPNLSALEGTWQLNYITGPRIAFDGLYPDNKPTITFEVRRNTVIGNTSCNSFSLALTADGKKISFPEPVTLGKLSCQGEGQSIFLKELKEVNRYDVTAGYSLSLFKGDVALMRFTRVR